MEYGLMVWQGARKELSKYKNAVGGGAVWKFTLKRKQEKLGNVLAYF